MAKMTQNNLDEYKKRLHEIEQTQFGLLSDDEILRFLAERKHLSTAVFEYEKREQEEAVRLEQEKKEAALKVSEEKSIAIAKKIEELNKSISPEKKDDDLLALIAQRKELEKEAAVVKQELTVERKEFQGAAASRSQVSVVDVPEKEVPQEKPEEKQTSLKEESLPDEKKEKRVPEEASFEIAHQQQESFGSEKIQDDGIEENSEFSHYFDQLKNNAGSLGEFLQQLPLAAKKNKAFMLKVAAIDPAYAMHYADKDTLKKEEDFNMRIASLNNPRNSGNALSEMLPEARTSKVLLVAVKQDYRNVKFVRPDMTAYDEIVNIAKKGALEKVKNLKEAADVTLLVPRLLQQDKQFMLLIKGAVNAVKNQ